jgi:hypothetical protein
MSRELLGMSGEEFLAAWDGGEFELTCDSRAIRVSMLIPFAR